MKCARCGHDSKKKDRVDGRCPSCQKVFAFDPNAGAPFSDMAFKAAIDRVSGEGKVRWHRDHLYFELVRLKGRKRSLAARIVGAGCVAAFITLVLGGAFVAAAGGPGALLALGVMVTTFSFAGWVALRRPAPLARDVFEVAWRRWNDVHGTPAALIAAPRAPAQLTDELRSELEAYSFDRAVVTDDRVVADTLLANNFHFENNCAVLTEDGHPEATFEVIRRMLKGNPDIRVFALHHATPSGCGLAHRLSTDPAWFEGVGKVVDVGLRPAHARRMPWAVETLPQPIDVASSPRLSAEEAKWLQKHRLSLRAIRPEQLVKRLFRAITTAESAGWSDDGDATFWIIGVDSGTSDGGGDSFG